MEDIIDSLSVNNKKKEIGKVYDFSTSWLAFAYRLQKNSFFIRKKLEIQNFTCNVCNMKLEEKFHLHHVTYSHCCDFKTYIIGKRGSKNPDCKLCNENNISFFQNCNDKTEIVHRNCHAKLHNTIKSKEYLESVKKDESLTNDFINRGTKWTTVETERFVQLAKDNMPIEMICKELGRNRGGIVARIKKYGFEEQYLP
jgi:hypothetical protein